MLINQALGIDTEGIDLPAYPWMKHIKDSHTNLQLAITENSHDKWYPNAMGTMTHSIELVSRSIAELLRPFVDGYDRFGFKEIRLKNIHVLDVLKWIFPNACFIFVFRKPDAQWSSIARFSKNFEYSNSFNEFLNEYQRLASLYIEFYHKNPESCLFVGENNLLQLDTLEAVLQQINIKHFDRTLLHEQVGLSPSVKSRYFLMRSYRALSKRAESSIVYSTLKKQGIFDVYAQLEQLEYKKGFGIPASQGALAEQ